MRYAMTGAALALCLAAGPALAQEKIAVTPELVAAAEKEGEITLLYSSPLVSMQGMTDDFRKTYPRIRINLERKAGSAGAQALLEEMAAGVNRIDLFQGSDMAASQELVDKRAFAAVEPAGLEGYGPASRVMAPYLYYPELNSTVISYNPKLVTDAEAEKLRSWTGVLDPVFKGRISVVEPVFGVTLAPLLYIMNTPGLGADYLRKLKAQQPHVYLNTAQAREAVVSGQKPISIGAQWEAVILSDITKGTPVRFVYPDPGVEWGGTSWGVVAKAKHPSAARLFLAWKFSREGSLSEQAAHSNNRPGLTNLDDVREGMKLVRDQPWFRKPQQVWNADPKDWIAKGPEYQELWASIMKGR